MTKLLITIALSIVCWTTVANGATTLNAWSEDTSESLARYSLKFAWEAYRALKVPTGQNVFYSPYSITNAVGMLILGSAGELETQLKAAIRIPSSLTDDQLHGQLSTENNKLLAETEAIIGVANRFFVNTPFVTRVNPDYKSELIQHYQSGLESTPFSTSPIQAQSTINDYVSEKTHGEIPEIVVQPPDSTTMLMLVNAVYFKGMWTIPFDEQFTRPDTFRTKTGNVTATFMWNLNRMEYARSDSLHAQMVSLTYTTNKKYAFYVIVPDAGHDLESLEASLDDVKIRQFVSRMTEEDVEVVLPRFSMKKRFNLNDMLQNLGARLDQPLNAQNSRIFTDPLDGSFIDEVIHEAKVTVNENGTVAAGGTFIGVALSSLPRHKQVFLNKPFLFFIADVSNGYVLFWGRVEDPSVSS